MLEFGVPIPFEFVEDEENMKKVRSMFRVNTDIPGAMEVVHPNKFLPSKSSCSKSYVLDLVNCELLCLVQTCGPWRSFETHPSFQSARKNFSSTSKR